VIVTIPEKFSSEVKYIFRVLFDQILGLKYTLKISSDIQNYVISLPNSKKVVITNSFFNSVDENNYLKLENIPSQVHSFVSDDHQNIPVIYGQPNIREENNKILCQLDLIASSFFMLTRWEEIVVEEKDQHSRFSSQSSLAYHNDFLNTPIVNVYADLLWNLLQRIGLPQKRKVRQFNKTWTIDMDMISMWPYWYSGVKSMGGDLLKRKSISAAIARSKHYLNFLRTNKDPYSNQEELALLEEHFDNVYYYWLVDSKFDAKTIVEINEDKLRSEIKKVQSRGRNIGLHPSYSSYQNLVDLKSQKTYLEQLSESDITEVRQHFLQVDVSTTWSLWEQAGFDTDSTMGYGDNVGFRHGMCVPFSLFDCLKRKELSVVERPLVFSDSVVGFYLDQNLETYHETTEKLLNEVKKHNGEFVFLWHNSSFYKPEWDKYLPLFDQIKEFK
jgi:hypothetical protein